MPSPDLILPQFVSPQIHFKLQYLPVLQKVDYIRGDGERGTYVVNVTVVLENEKERERLRNTIVYGCSMKIILEGFMQWVMPQREILESQQGHANGSSSSRALSHKSSTQGSYRFSYTIPLLTSERPELATPALWLNEDLECDGLRKNWQIALNDDIKIKRELLQEDRQVVSLIQLGRAQNTVERTQSCCLMAFTVNNDGVRIQIVMLITPPSLVVIITLAQEDIDGVSFVCDMVTLDSPTNSNLSSPYTADLMIAPLSCILTSDPSIDSGPQGRAKPCEGVMVPIEKLTLFLAHLEDYEIICNKVGSVTFGGCKGLVLVERVVLWAILLQVSSDFIVPDEKADEVDVSYISHSKDSQMSSLKSNHLESPNTDTVTGRLEATLKKITEARCSRSLEDGSWVEAMQEENVAGTQKDERERDCKLSGCFGLWPLIYGWVCISAINDVKSAFCMALLMKRQVVVCDEFEDLMQSRIHTNKSWCDEFEALMQSRFQMSSMGELTFFLGLQVKQNKEGIFISQDKYVAEILKKFDLVHVKAAITPMETKLPLTKDEEAFDVDVHLYRSMIGSLMYLTASRPDIMYAVCVCSRFQVTPKTSHLNAVKRIFKYLKGKPNLGLWYPRDSPLDLEAFSDSDYGGSNLDRKSTTGGCQFLGQRLISWQCKKQTIVATSTTEAEYVAAANCCGQVLWVQNQLLDYGFNFMNTKIHIDNESTICIVKNPVYHSKTKHIEIRHHFIRDCYEKKLISVEKIHTDLNVADLLTKPFDGPRFHYLVVSIEIVDFLRRSKLRYALTHNPPIYDSLVKQFWQTATARTLADGTQQLDATIDTIEYTITEESVRRQLQLADASGIHMLQNEEIFAGLQNIGYVNDRTFTFWKSHFTPQWRFLIHHILHCLYQLPHHLMYK
ncbi:putative ribonuclease H-like domain-containing protein [Tanacetum coccineum]